MPANTNPRPEQIRVGETVRALREARGLRVGDLARALGVSHSYISQIESGAKPLPARRVRDFADALGVRPGALVRPDLYHEDRAS
jgi:transcriptional regulator with XRE-family HTH domain